MSPAGPPLRISFYGDVCLHGLDPERYAIDPELRALARGSTLNVANLEGPLTEAADPMSWKAVHLRGAPVASPILEHFDVFSLANNHILDYREAGLRDTMRLLERLGKHHFGAGLDRRSALEPRVVAANGLSVAFLGFTRWQCAGRRSAGTAPDRARPLLRRVRRLREAGHFVVCYPHWNYEYLDVPAPVNRRLGHRLVEAGADLVVGSHPHVLQGLERHQGRWICHSLGNFVFDSEMFSEAERGAGIHTSVVLTATVDANRQVEIELTPVHTDHQGVTLLKGEAGARVLAHVRELSDVLADEREASRRFYRGATQGVGKADQGMAAELREQGLRYLLSRLHRVRAQDLKIKLHGLLGRS